SSESARSWFGHRLRRTYEARGRITRLTSTRINQRSEYLPDLGHVVRRKKDIRHVAAMRRTRTNRDSWAKRAESKNCEGRSGYLDSVSVTALSVLKLITCGNRCALCSTSVEVEDYAKSTRCDDIVSR